MTVLPTLALATLLPLHAGDILQAGAPLPDATVRDAEGEKVTLADLVDQTPTVLVFYRGGWCPYCNAHLSELANVEEQLREAGYQIIALSPDSPANVKEALGKSDFPFKLVSDSEMNAAKAFGLAFTVDEQTVDQLKGHGIDLEAASGKQHRMLPVPAVFLVNPQSEITFSHSDPDYKERLSNEDLLRAAGL